MNPIDTTSSFVTLGTVFNRETKQEHVFKVGHALDHNSGRLTNEKLMAMTDHELRQLAYSADGRTVFLEKYVTPSDKDWCKRGDYTPNTVYDGAHRAVTILHLRDMQKLAG